MKTLIAAAALALYVSSPPPNDVRPVGISQIERGVVMILQGYQFTCPPGTRRGYIVTSEFGVWAGCWTRNEQHVTFVDEDGDAFEIPVSRVNWMRRVERTQR